MKVTPAKLKKLRKHFELSQFEVSKMTKISRYNLSLFENGFRPLTNKEEISIASMLVKLTEEGEASHVATNKEK